jgi:adenylate cyclase
MAGDYKKAIPILEKAIERVKIEGGQRVNNHTRLIQALVESGQIESANNHAAEVLKLDPNFSLKNWQKSLFYKNPSDLELNLSALRKAGLPDEPPLPLPDKPSIAVLAFDNLSGDPEQEYFSDGISEEIINALTKTDQLFVIARNSSFTYKGKPVDVKQISRELGVRYVLEGSVRKSKDQVRITAQLIDATTGHHLWSDRYDRELKEIFAVQDEITMKIVTALRVRLTEGEQARLWSKKYENIDILLKSMESLSLWRKGTKESHIRQGQVAQEIIEIAPESPAGYRSLAWYYWYLFTIGESPQESVSKAFKLAQKALTLDESDASTQALLGSIYLLMRKYKKAITAGERSIELAPNGAMYHGLLGLTLNFAGRQDEAIKHLKQGIRLNPFPAYWYFGHLSRCYLLKRQYEDALTAAKKALHLSPDAPSNHRRLAIIYTLSNRQEEASAATKKALELDPNFSVERAKKLYPFKNQADLKFYIAALRKAGFPEGG